MTSFINSVSQRLSAHFSRTQEEQEPETEEEQEEAPRPEYGFLPYLTHESNYMRRRICSGLGVSEELVPGQLPRQLRADDFVNNGDMTYSYNGLTVTREELQRRFNITIPNNMEVRAMPEYMIGVDWGSDISAPRHFASEAQIELERRLIRDVTTTQDGHKMNAKLNEFYKLMKEEVKTISEEFQDDPEAASCADGIMEQFEIMFKEVIKNGETNV